MREGSRGASVLPQDRILYQQELARPATLVRGARRADSDGWEAAVALERAIREAADLDSSIGGPITLLEVSRAGEPLWLQNPPNDHGWTRVCDIVEAYRNGRTSIFFTDTKEGLDRYLAGSLPQAVATSYNLNMKVPRPVNQPVRSFAPGTPERATLRKSLAQQSSQQIEIPLLIDGKEVRTGRTAKTVMPHRHKHVLATWHKAEQRK